MSIETAPEAPKAYVIYTPDHDDFLTRFEMRDDQTFTGWDPKWQTAVQFSTYEDAHDVARQIVANMLRPENEKYQIVLCSITDLGDQWQVESIAEIFAEVIPGSPN
jgi:hypothetical protein